MAARNNGLRSGIWKKIQVRARIFLGRLPPLPRSIALAMSRFDQYLAAFSQAAQPAPIPAAPATVVTVQSVPSSAPAAPTNQAPSPSPTSPVAPQTSPTAGQLEREAFEDFLRLLKQCPPETQTALLLRHVFHLYSELDVVRQREIATIKTKCELENMTLHLQKDMIRLLEERNAYQAAAGDDKKRARVI